MSTVPKQVGVRSHVKPLFIGRKLAINSSIVILSWGLIGLAYPLFVTQLVLPIAITRSSLFSEFLVHSSLARSLIGRGQGNIPLEEGSCLLLSRTTCW
ncbi:hypothetical protein CPB84DRAFT_1453918 [Gymnopilus junonius]|uniref:Uncharacterized protein n=1 Tax=Gymnopilus junonius TaxID=109634 RepID=A0A9P5TLD1_GYMJU|nr:hypothetical protein CPB84DRAFT_1453918 [Gymnopilus junonius]